VLSHQLRIKNGKRLQLLGFLWLLMLLSIWNGLLLIKRLIMSQVLQVGVCLVVLSSSHVPESIYILDT
jgi:hypothetical protein